MSKTINTDLNFTLCKYLLPCGKCDKTGELCTDFQTFIFKTPYPFKKENIIWLNPSEETYTKTED